MPYSETVWEFRTARFTVALEMAPSDHLDLSWDESGETAAKLESGELIAFDSVVTVRHRGEIIGSDSLCESIYANPFRFWQDHRDSNPMNRNCSLMRFAKGGNAAICHYFPDMVRNTITEARETLAARSV